MAKKQRKESKKEPKKEKAPGDVLFERYYGEIYGERWEKLKEALYEPVQKSFFQWQEDLPQYELDQASKLVASSLPIKPGDKVLDLCAAPGGKSLFLAHALREGGELTCNELSKDRRSRLKRVLREHLPGELNKRIDVTGHDGSRWGLYEKEVYDAILVDAPCSGERHLLERPSELQNWSQTRGKHLAHRQYALLAAAYMAAKPASFILYSTCTINPVENDEVVRKFLKKKQGLQVERSIENPEGLTLEETEFGFQILPDRAGCGPMYFSLIQKK